MSPPGAVVPADGPPDLWPVVFLLGLPVVAIAGVLYGVLPWKARGAMVFDATRPPTPLSPDEPFPAGDETFLEAAVNTLSPYGFGPAARLGITAPALKTAPAVTVRWALLTDVPVAPGDRPWRTPRVGSGLPSSAVRA